MNKQRIIVLIICILLIACGVIQSFAESESIIFTDVKEDDWFHEILATASERGIVSGYPDGSFRPSKTVSYGEFLAMSMNLEKLKAPENPVHWAQVYYDAAVNRGIVKESDFSLQDLDKTIPRKHMALILAGLINARDKKPSGSPSVFSDISGSAYSSEISCCSAAGVLSGYPDGSFRPENGLSRSEAAAAVLNYIKLLDGEMNEGYKVLEIYENGNLLAVSEENGYVVYCGHNSYAIIDEPDPNEELPAEDLMREDHKALLNQVLATAKISGTKGNYSFTYTQPQIPDQYHFAVDLHIYEDNDQGGSSTVFFENSDPGWIMHPENYDPSAKTVTMKLDGVTSLDKKSVILKLAVYDILDEYTLEYGEGAQYVYSLDSDGTYMLVCDASRYYDGEVKDYSTVHKGVVCSAFCW